MKILIFLAALVSVSYAFAAEDYAGNIGASYGLSVPDATGTTSRSILGLQGTAKLGSEWGLGGYYMTSSKSENYQGTTFDFNYQLYGVKGSYHFEGDAHGAYFGAMVGISKVKQGSADTSPTHYGVLAGYDKMLGDLFSIGGEFTYIHIDQSDSSVNGTSNTVDKFNTLNFMVAVKFWF